MKLKVFNIDIADGEPEVYLRLEPVRENVIELSLVDRDGDMLGGTHLMNFCVNFHGKLSFYRIGCVSPEFVEVSAFQGKIVEGPLG